MAWKLQFKVCCEEVDFKIYETLNYYEKLRKVEQRKSSKRTRVDLVRSTCWLDHFVFGKIQLICIFAGPSEFGHCWTFGRIKHDSIVVVRTALVFSRNRQNRSNYIRQELVNVPVVVTEPHQTRPQLHGYSYLYRIQFQVGQGPSASPKYRTAGRLRSGYSCVWQLPPEPMTSTHTDIPMEEAYRLRSTILVDRLTNIWPQVAALARATLSSRESNPDSGPRGTNQSHWWD